jgi:hypothetical protein
MRYVHVPIQYSKVTPEEMIRIAKTFREMEPPFYVHCYHGKHRGPTAAAIGRMAIDGASRERALAEMRQWCGTSEKYLGLYRDIARSPIPTAEACRDLVWNFPARAELEGYRHAMVEAARAFDHLKALSKHDWRPYPEHPDVDARNEAAKLAQIMGQAAELERVTLAPKDFQGWSKDGAAWSRKLHERLTALAEGDAAARGPVDEAFRAVKRSCTDCHAAYRNE